jgi:hypothetical protein
MDHHWCKSGLAPDPDNYFGFVYIITNNITGRKYIGKKQYYHRVAKVKKGRKRYQNVDGGWQFYSGSSAELTRDIEKDGKENFTFRILSHHKWKSSLWYAEIKEIVLRDALPKREEYYNGMIPAMKFRPKSDEDEK